MGLTSDRTADGFPIATLSDGSEKSVAIECDTCGAKLVRKWRDYRSSQLRYGHDGKTYCKACVNRQNGKKKRGKPVISSAKANYKAGQHHSYKDGRYVASDGYVMVRVGVGVYEREHVLRIAESIGRDVNHSAGEVVHHVDLDRGNNDLSNLVLFASESEHKAAHKSLDLLVPRLIKAGLLLYRRDTNEYVPSAELAVMLGEHAP